MSQQQFRMTSKHTRNFGIMVGLGVVLLILGYVLSNVELPAQEHGDHGNSHGTEKHEEHSGGGEDHHSDAGELVKYASAGHDVSVGGPGHGHGDHGDEAHADSPYGHHSDHIVDGTWKRAPVDTAQYIMEHHHKEITAKSKFGAALLGGTFFWIAIALFGVFFIAVGYLANAGWYVVFKRVLENFYRFLPVGAVLLVVIFFVFGSDVYDWVRIEEGHDFLIDGKRSFLNVVFYLATAVLIVGLWTLFGHIFKTLSKKEEASGDLAHHKKGIRFSAMFLPIFALGFSACCFMWMMSVDPHWFSTIYAVYCFAGLFVSGMTITMFISTHLYEKGFMPNLSGDHLHDMGKFMFAFSVFWAYIWVSQYLLIWYANIPEETFYFYQRMEDYKFLFAINVVINFVFPFLVMMTRDSKRQIASLRSVGRILLFGRFLDIYLLIAPGVLADEGGFTTMLMMAGCFLIIGGIFLFIVFKGLEDSDIEPRKHPYFEESVHHSTGV